MPMCTRLSVIACLLLPFIALGQELPVAAPEEVGMSSAVLGQVGPAMQVLVDQHKIAGAIVVVARRGRVVHFETVGMMDIASARPMADDAILRFYSMTKPITTAAAMILCDQGKCRLDDPVSKYLPEFRDVQVFVRESPDGLELEPPAREMTIKDLALHTAGMTYGWGGTPVDKLYAQADLFATEGTLQDTMGRLAKLPLKYQPGRDYEYSISIDVLGRVIEVASGMPLDRFFEQYIFEPLDMKDTGFHVPEDKLGRFASIYGPDDAGGLEIINTELTERLALPATVFSGGGGLVSTARDYTRFCQMLLNKGELNGTRILRSETVELMTRNHLRPGLFPIEDGKGRIEGVGFGLGFSVRVHEALDSTGHVAEYGWSGAASTHFWVSPKEELILIALSQYRPFSFQLADVVKPIVYSAIEQTQ